MSAVDQDAAALPNEKQRPDGELERLRAPWAPPRGWRIFSAVNNTYVGLAFIAMAVVNFVLAGILATIMRTQLAVPENDLIGHDLYNQLFTMHGTMMMFLFAVPAVEAVAVYLLPSMLGSRELPFPRLSAYAFWTYAVGSLAFFTTIFFGVAPDGGWFMYPPLTSYVFSPEINADFWLLGIGFIEISAIAGAIEIIVGILRTRAPGMTLDKLPVFAWAMLVFAFMVLFAFPAVILCTLLLELERAFHWPFFIEAKGGDPLLWQHLFWFFGHPEVYVIFLPAIGMVSMIVPTMAQTPLLGYRLVVLALLATGFLSFGLWVHHMFTTGIPELSLGFFSAASFAVAVPSGIQVFAWIATIANGKLKLTTPALFILGFLFIFTLGGLTGVMVATVPFDWQAHDTYFIVAHLHYVLIGGMVFPLFAGFYYWYPTASAKPLSERVGRWVFGLMFVGTNVTFFTMHITGLVGMPRRQYTYLAELDWGGLNMVSTIGAYMIAAGVALFLFDVARTFRFSFDRSAGNIFNAGTPEWLPTSTYGVRSIPHIRSRYPLWDQENLAQEVDAGRHYLARTITGKREALVTSPLEARPQYVLQVPGAHWGPFIGAMFTAAFFLLLTGKMVLFAAVCAAIALAAILWWLWDLDEGPVCPPADIGGGIVVPVYRTGPVNHAWWGTALFILFGAILFACLLFAYFFLWTVNPVDWIPAEVEPRAFGWPAGAAGLYLAGSLGVFLAGRALAFAPRGSAWPVRIALLLAMPAMILGGFVDLYGHWQAGLRPSESSYGAVVYAITALQAHYVALLAIMGTFTLVRSLAGKLDGVRRSTFDNTMLVWHYATLQGLIGLAIVHAFPRLIG